jgi:hypothetical protein
VDSMILEADSVEVDIPGMARCTCWKEVGEAGKMELRGSEGSDSWQRASANLVDRSPLNDSLHVTSLMRRGL